MGHLFHLHPLIVHFPVALFITALGMEVLSWILKKEALHQAAYYNYLLGIAGGVAAVLAAWFDGQVLKHPVFYTHKTLAYWTVGFALACAVILFLVKRRKSKKVFRIIFFIFLFLTAVFVSLTGYYGGRLVYEYGVGVQE